jgi:hypothetical protein
MWKEAEVVKFEVLSWNSPGGTEESHEKQGRIACVRAEV